MFSPKLELRVLTLESRDHRSTEYLDGIAYKHCYIVFQTILELPVLTLNFTWSVMTSTNPEQYKTLICFESHTNWHVVLCVSNSKY